MASLEQLRPGLQVDGIVPGQTVSIISVERRGENAVEIVYRLPNGKPDTHLLFRHNEANLKIVQAGRRWDLTGDGTLFRLISEAYRIRLAHLFDPRLAVHTSLIDPLPHQITAVYGAMLPRHPLRYLLADDPGAGKTIMAGLLLKELFVRGDVRRCLICVPGSLATQWQDELWFKFQLPFHVLTRDMIDASRTGNPFDENNLLIIRLDQVSRNDDLQMKLRRTDWDIVICDEAHKMSANYFGGKLHETRRYKLGRLLSGITRHFLLMTATPHNGKEEDFQLFMALLDQDRFEGRFREDVYEVDTSDLMRRMVKEKLVKFDGRPLFPERRAYTVDYPLSYEEQELYEAVTAYVREEFNRANALENGGRRGTVGFALTILQRRLASSPEAIYRSLERRRKRLEKRIQEERQPRSRREMELGLPIIDEEDWDALEDADEEELAELEEQVFDSATAAQTIAELQAEIETLKDLERMAYQVWRSGKDRKWDELSTLLQDNPYMFDANDLRRKLVIFTEHRDTLNYLSNRLRTLLGRNNALVTIHGALRRDERRAIQERFLNNPDVYILLATDAAGEGINLQRAHLMVNYDLPWNPNRLEQRFGRIHRIGQTEVCHLWNLVAGQTREGQVYRRLLEKLEAERGALNGQVFDVLGQLFEQGEPLRKLLMEAVVYGDSPEVRAKLHRAIDNAVDQDRVRELLEQHSLATQALDTTEILRIRGEMERAAARRLQPHYIRSFFMAAFEELGGTIREREPGRYQITYVPRPIRSHAQTIGTPLPVMEKYERVTFDKAQINIPGQPYADFICPGHPLLDTLIDLLLQRHRSLLKQGAVLVDDTDPGDQPRMLFYLEQEVQDGLSARDNAPPLSKQLHFVEVDAEGVLRHAGYAPYLDYRPITEDERQRIQPHLEADWLDVDRLEEQVRAYAIEHLVADHLAALREQREALVDKTLAAVQDRLSKEIVYWDRRVAELRRKQRAGKHIDSLNIELAQRRVNELSERLAERKAELALQKQLMPRPPVVLGGALIIPLGMLLDAVSPALIDGRVTEQAAMRAVLQAEAALGHHPVDVSARESYDIESRTPGPEGTLRFIEVKGRRSGAQEVTLTRNEILQSLNAPEKYLLALVEVAADGKVVNVRYVRDFERTEPAQPVTSVSYNLKRLLEHSEEPA
ncbi:MAG: DUF3883 domain-containing protein [Anaerolineae bacterium]|nr:DUF3883 domain-containing protein [Anaerolineae bacterium]